MQRPLIQLSNVYKKFGTNQVLRGVSLRIFKGQVTTIIGKSGTGKSVLLKHMIGLHRPVQGRILIDGMDVAHDIVRGDSIETIRIEYPKGDA